VKRLTLPNLAREIEFYHELHEHIPARSAETVVADAAYFDALRGRVRNRAAG
jgi:hypothetical protein